MDQTLHQANLRDMCRYYDRTEASYRLLLRGTKHFGWYEPGQSRWRFLTAQRQMECALIQNLLLPAGCHVLDVGSGKGHVARRIASRHGLLVTGVDVRASNTAEARRRSAASRLEDKTFFVTSDYHCMAFPDASFDGVYTMEALAHSTNVPQALAEFSRVLRPAGRLVMFEYSRTPVAKLSPAANQVMTNVCKRAATPAWLRLNHGDLEKLMEEAGLSQCKSVDVTSRMLPMLRAFSILGTLPYSLFEAFGHGAYIVNAMIAVEMYSHQEAWRYNIYTANKGP